MLQRVLIAIDFSTASAQALAVARQHCTGANIRLLHVMRPSDVAASSAAGAVHTGTSPLSSKDMRESAEKKALEQLESWSQENEECAIGVGNADLITEKVWEAMDYEATVMNGLTGISLRKAAIPVRLPTDRKAIQACFTTLGPVPPDAVRAILIRDTRHLSEIWISRAMEKEIAAVPWAEIGEPAPLPFDDAGNLALFD